VHLGSVQPLEDQCLLDIQRETNALASSVMASLSNIWQGQCLSLPIKIWTCKALVVSVLLYAADMDHACWRCQDPWELLHEMSASDTRHQVAWSRPVMSQLQTRLVSLQSLITNVKRLQLNFRSHHHCPVHSPIPSSSTLSDWMSLCRFYVHHWAMHRSSTATANDDEGVILILTWKLLLHFAHKKYSYLYISWMLTVGRLFCCKTRNN